MNTLVNMAAAVACLWLAIEAYTTWSEPALGVAMVLLILFFILQVLLAVADDIDIVRGNRHDEDE